MTVTGLNLIEKETEMKRLAALSAGLILGSPRSPWRWNIVRVIGESARLYFIFMGAILIYGVYDSFGKKAMYVAAPIIRDRALSDVARELNTDARMRWKRMGSA